MDRDNSGFDIRPGASDSKRRRFLRSGVVVNWLIASPAEGCGMEDTSVPLKQQPPVVTPN
jgi:hypothetical protein